MLLAATWRDLRGRIAAGLLLTVPLAAFVSFSFAVQRSQPADAPAGVIALGRSYPAYIDTAWFHLPSPSFVIAFAAILITSGGVLARPRIELVYLLALPTTGRAWVLAHLAGSIAATALIAAVSAAVLLMGGWWQGTSYPVLRMLANSSAVVLAAVPWVTTSAAVLAFVRRPVLAIMLVLGLIVFLPGSWFGLMVPATPHSPVSTGWDPWLLADPRLWQGGPLLRALLISALISAVGVTATLLRFERIEP
jgi:hypothetical protein